MAAACAPTIAPTPSLDQIVQQTFVALTAQAAVSTPRPAASAPSTPTIVTTGSIAGALNYPADSLPAMRVVVFSATNSQSYFYVDTPAGQNWYQLNNLPPGTYTVVAYSLGGAGFPVGLAGGFTEVMRGNANNHALVTVTVTAGQITQNINPGDWYVAANAFPPMPGPTPSPNLVEPPTLKPEGGITGTLTYPSESLPAMGDINPMDWYAPNETFPYSSLH